MTMSSQLTPLAQAEPWQREISPKDLLPFSPDDSGRDQIVSDAVKLRVATALQSSLHVRDVIKGFARETRRLIKGTGVRFRHKASR